METFFFALGCTGLLMVGAAFMCAAGWALLAEIREWRDKRDCQLVYRTEVLQTKKLGDQIVLDAHWFTTCNDGYAVALAIGRTLHEGAGYFRGDYARDHVLRQVLNEFKEQEGK